MQVLTLNLLAISQIKSLCETNKMRKYCLENSYERGNEGARLFSHTSMTEAKENNKTLGLLDI